MARLTLAQRFAAKVEKQDDGCWRWAAYRDRDGYGRFAVRRRVQYAHRVAYELCVGPIPEGLTLDHLCRNPACVNPEHLEPVTLRTNIGRGGNSAKTHCLRGHAFDDNNTYRHGHSRHCMACWRERTARKKAAT